MKKKMLFISTFIIALLIGIVNIGNEKVKAEDNSCTKKTNYYLLLSATGKDYYTAKNDAGESSVSITTGKEFKLGTPKDVKVLSEGLVNISHNSTDGVGSMSLDTFHKYFTATGDNVPYSTDNINYYIRAIDWFNTSGSAENSSTDIPSTSSEFKALVPSKLNDKILSAIDDDKKMFISISRTWNYSELSNIDEDKIVFSPAVYYVQYEVCGYDTIANYIEKSTNTKLGSEVLEKNLPTGDVYEGYNCPETYTVNNKVYERTTTDNYSYSGGTIANKNVEFNCYYTEKVKKSTITINFGTNKDCTTGTEIRKSETKEYNVGENVKYTIPSISGYEFSETGNVLKAFDYKVEKNNLVFTAPNKNTTICLVYIKNPKTGAGWIYFAWIIGVAALAYSIWYFVRYNKTNSEV